MRGIWKKIGWGICVVTMVSMLVAGIFLILILYSFKNIQLEEEVLTSGDFIYWVNDDYVVFEGLSEQGKEKETIVVPQEIDGYKVEKLTRPYGFGYRGYFESENVKQIYIVPNLSWSPIISGDRMINLEKVVFIGVSNSISDLYASGIYNVPMVYFSSIKNYHNIQASETGLLNYGDEDNFWLSNCNYFYNYEGAENDGYYWSDNYNYGEKIAYIPQDPEREGYIFGGWFQEPECVNVWNFDTDTLPEAKYNEDGEALYQETRLYAKWLKSNE